MWRADVELGEEGLSRFFSLTAPFLDERQRRLLAASMVEVLGRGDQARVAEATGMSRNTLIAGAKDLAEGPVLGERIRRPGAGPKRKIDLDPELLVVLDSLVEPESRGDPMSPLRWTLKSTRVLAAELTRLGHKVGANLVGDLLHYLGYSLQANAKVTEGTKHADRDAQFRCINDRAGREPVNVRSHFAQVRPNVCAFKNKELVGDYANGGKEWEPEGTPTRVGVHDFPDPEMGKAILVSKLEHEGLAERRADPTDARGVLLVLTAAGRRYVRDRRQVGADLLVELIDGLPADQARSLCAALPALEAIVALAHRRADGTDRLATSVGEAQR